MYTEGGIGNVVATLLNDEQPPTAEEVKAATVEKSQPNAKVELEPKLSIEKSPLFLNPTAVEVREKPAGTPETKTNETASVSADLPSRVLVKGPIQTEVNLSAKETQSKRPSSSADDEPKGVFDQLRQDVDNATKALSPFKW